MKPKTVKSNKAAKNVQSGNAAAVPQPAGKIAAATTVAAGMAKVQPVTTAGPSCPPTEGRTPQDSRTASPTAKSAVCAPVCSTSAAQAKTPVQPAKTEASVPSPAEEVVTTIAAKIDVGLGNALFIRGQGEGLSWEQGFPLHCVDPSTWVWSTTGAKGKLVFKLLLNDQRWALGEDVTVEAGKRTELVPKFQ